MGHGTPAEATERGKRGWPTVPSLVLWRCHSIYGQPKINSQGAHLLSDTMSAALIQPLQKPNQYFWSGY